MQLIIQLNGTAKCLYDESIDLAALGHLDIRRASHVEPDASGNWHADLAPVGGPRLGPFRSRSDALAAEVQWLEENHLQHQPKGPHDFKQSTMDHGLQRFDGGSRPAACPGNPASQGDAVAAVGHHHTNTEDGE